MRVERRRGTSNTLHPVLLDLGLNMVEAVRMCMRVKRWTIVSPGQTSYGPKSSSQGRFDRSILYLSVAIKEDGGDPDFLKNLSRLGQVAVPKPGTPFEKASPMKLDHLVSLRRFLTDTSSSFDKYSKRLPSVPSCPEPRHQLPQPLLLKTTSPQPPSPTCWTD